jgi:hypothetical protein
MRRQLLAVLAPLLVGALPLWAEDADPLAGLAQLGNTLAMAGPEAGGSIRAKKDADLTEAKRKSDKRNYEASVVEIKRAAFPAIALKLKVVKQPSEGDQKSAVAKNEDVVIIPELKIAGNQPDMADEATLINAGAFYLRAGDKVVLRLKEKKDKVWVVEYIERK